MFLHEHTTFDAIRNSFHQSLHYDNCTFFSSIRCFLVCVVVQSIQVAEFMSFEISAGGMAFWNECSALFWVKLFICYEHIIHAFTFFFCMIYNVCSLFMLCSFYMNRYHTLCSFTSYFIQTLTFLPNPLYHTAIFQLQF